MKNLLPIGLLMTMVAAQALAGEIDLGTPLVSGDVSVFRDDGATERRPLSPEQLQALSRWFEQDRRGWQGMSTEASPNERLEFEIQLKHSDEHTSTIEVIAGVRGGHYLRLTGPGTWAYRSLAGFYKTWAATRPISDMDLAALRSLIGTGRAIARQNPHPDVATV